MSPITHPLDTFNIASQTTCACINSARPCNCKMLRHFAARLYPAVSLAARKPARLAAAATTSCKLSTSAALSSGSSDEYRLTDTQGVQPTKTAPLYPYEYIRTERRGQKQNVGFIQLKREKALNALCDGLMTEVGEALRNFDNDPHIGAIVITGR